MMIDFLFAIFMQLENPEPPTWYKDIYPIVQENCSLCHSNNGAGPFALKSYDDVANRSSFIYELISEGRMPPWLPSNAGVTLQHKRSLSENQVKLFKQWIDAAKPKGSGAEYVVCDSPPESTAATGQTPLNLPWIIPAESAQRWHKGVLDKRTFVLPINNEVPLKITSLQYQTTAPKAVQMVALVFDETKRGATLDSWDEEPGYEMMGDMGWSPSGLHGKLGPGQGKLNVPMGFHFEIPANVDLIAETHYRPTGKKESLSSSVSVWCNPKVGSRPLQEIVTMLRRIYIDAEDASYSDGEEIKLEHNVDLVGITPRAGPECVAMRLEAIFPDTTKTILLDIPDWDPHYGETIFLQEALSLPAGTAIKSVWHYNNSESNARNPFVPAQLIDLGRRTGVANFILHVAPVNASDAKSISQWNLSLIRNRQRDNTQ